MAHIYVYSPSGAVRDKLGFRRGLKRLKDLGHELEIDPDALASKQRFAGDDATRIRAIARAAASKADLTLITRGGYGLTRILPQIDYRAVAASIANGTQWMGLSDFSAFQAALFKTTGARSVAGASLIADWGCEGEVDDIMQDCFEDTVLRRDEGAGWTLAKSERALYAGFESKSGAILWGSSLTVMTALLGTPYLPSVKKGILFFEDTGESPYRIERMLSQWLHSGILAQQQAIVLGQFTHYKLYPHDKGFAMKSVLAWLRSKLKIPVFTGLPFGHVTTKVMLPFGASVRLLTDDREAILLW